MNPGEVKQLIEAVVKKFLPTWSVKYIRHSRKLGRCCYRAKEIRLNIDLIRLGTPTEVKQVVLHEIAHATSKGRGHRGSDFLTRCQDLNCNPASTIKISYTPNYKWTTICPTCNTCWRRFKRINYSSRRCLKCDTILGPPINLEHQQNSIPDLLTELGIATTKTEKSRIRRELRILGHIGGLRKEQGKNG